MMPPARFADVARYLKRHRLDTLFSAFPPNHALSDGLITASEPLDAVQSPRRPVTLHVLRHPENGAYVIICKSIDTGKQLMPATNDQLNTTMLNCYVTKVRFDVMEDGLLDSLAPHAHRWHHKGLIEKHPKSFPNADALLRFFDRLAVTTGTARIDFGKMELPFELVPSQFWAAEVFHHARCLEVLSMPPNMQLRTLDIVAWLSSRPAHYRSDERKFLTIHECGLREPYMTLYEKLHELFNAATMPTLYILTVRLQQPCSFKEVFRQVDNQQTGERLLMQPCVDWHLSDPLSGADLMNTTSSSLVICRMMVSAQLRTMEDDLERAHLL